MIRPFPVSLPEHLEELRERAAQMCLRCGACVSACPVMAHVELPEGMSIFELQDEMAEALAGGDVGPGARTRVSSCMECFGCATVCPMGFDPMQVNAILRARLAGEHAAASRDMAGFSEARGAENDFRRVLAQLLTEPEETERLFKPVDVDAESDGGVVFFPGCNVYAQPDKLLAALDLMTLAEPGFGFLPGLGACCGEEDLTRGEPLRGEAAMHGLLDRLKRTGARTVVLWCATCLCRLEEGFARTGERPFEIVSFARFLADCVDRLPLGKAPLSYPSMTLHEPCKSARNGLDANGCRDLLAALGAEVRPMIRQGVRAICCGGGAAEHFPDAVSALLDDRLREADEAGAGALVTVCHWCHHQFVGHRQGMEILNLVLLVAESCGLRREDRYGRYRRLGDPDLVLEERGGRLAVMGLPREQIARAVAQAFSIGAGR